MKSTIKQAIEADAQKIYERDGGVKPSQLLDAARPVDSPSHAGFEWRDSVAAEEYRLTQARQWLRVVVVRTGENAPERMAHIPAENGRQEGEYKPISVLVDDVDEFQRALSAASSRLNAARESIHELESVARKSDNKDRTAILAQLSRGFDLMQGAITSLH